MRAPATLVELIAGFPERGDDPAILASGSSGELASITYAALHSDITRFASGLHGGAFRDGALVLLWAPNSPAWVMGWLGVAAAGCVPIPLDDQADEEALRAVLRQSTPACAVTVIGHVQSLHQAGMAAHTPIILLDADGDARSWKRLPRGERQIAARAGDERRVAVLLYTSGTTGVPKGVPLTHANLMSNVHALLAAGIVSRTDRVLLPLPLHHAYAATVGMLTILARGAAIVLPSGITGPELTAAVARARVRILIGVPRLYEALLESIHSGVRMRGPAARALFHFTLRCAGILRRRLGINVGRVLFRSVHRRVGPSLRILASGGARLDSGVAEQLEALGWLVLTGYGLTETSPIVTFNAFRRRRLDSEGRPLAGVELRIAGGPGEGGGEIQVRGPNVFQGYWQDAEATARAFTEDGWFRTGDMGWIDDQGFLHVIGRRSEVLVLSDGKKITPEPLERRYEASPYIREVALLAPHGDLLALVVPDDDAIRARGTMSARTVLRDELDAVMSTLPRWQRVREYRVVRRKLPRTRLGKLRRHLLPALYAEASSTRAASAAVELDQADHRLLDSARVRPVWQWLRERYPGVEPDSSPQLDLGIDSLGWVTLTAEMEERFGVSPGGEQLSRVLTMRDLLRAIDSAPGAAGCDARRDARTDDALRYLEAPGPLRWLLALFVMAFVRAAMAGPYRLRVSGREHLPAGGGFVIAPNHASYLDPLALAAALSPSLRRRTCWAGWSAIMHRGPAWRAASRALRVFPVDPDRDLGRALRVAARVLEAGDVLVWFPEGRRSRDGSLQPFRRGIGVLLEQVPAPVVPARIDGTFAAWPPHRRWPRLAALSVTFGPVQSPASLRERGSGGDGAERIGNALAQAVAGL